MRNPLTMFLDEDGSGDWSMTRIVAFAFAWAYIDRLGELSVLGASLGWPDAFLAFAILFAIPFKTLFSGSSGATLLGKFIDRFGIGSTGTNAAPEAVKAVLDFKRGLDNAKTDDERG